MKKNINLLIFSSILLSSCIKTGKPLVSDFTPSSSMCLDSLIVNLSHHGCKNIVVEKHSYGISKIYCGTVYSETDSSKWISEEFYAISYGSRIPNDVKPICGDPFLILTNAERD